METSTKDLSGSVVSFNGAVGTMQVSRVLSNLSHCCPSDAGTQPVVLSNLWQIKSNPTHSLSNMCIENTIEANDELRRITPGSVILDVAGQSQGRNVASLHSLATKVKQYGVSLLFSCNIVPSIDQSIDVTVYEEQILKKLREEILVGCSIASDAATESLKRAQVYAKASAVVCDLGLPFMPPKTALSECEISALKSCGKFHAELHKDKHHGRKVPPVIVSLPPFSTTHAEILCVLREAGADISKVVFNQVSLTARDTLYWVELLTAYPCSVCIDTWGYAATFNALDSQPFASDYELLEQVLSLVQSGFGSRVILSLAVYCKIQLTTYGGYGYDYLQSVIAPALRSRLSAIAGIHTNNAANNTVCTTTIDITAIDPSTTIQALTGGNIWSLVNWRPPPPVVAVEIEYLCCHICAKKFIPGNHFSKFGFEYCTTKCLGVHRNRDWK